MYRSIQMKEELLGLAGSLNKHWKKPPQLDRLRRRREVLLKTASEWKLYFHYMIDTLTRSAGFQSER